MILTTIISLVIPDLGKVFELTGAIAAYPIDFLLPALAFSKICLFDGRHGKEPGNRTKNRFSKKSNDVEESIHEVLTSKSAEDSEDLEPNKFVRLCDLRFFFPIFDDRRIDYKFCN